MPAGVTTSGVLSLVSGSTRDLSAVLMHLGLDVNLMEGLVKLRLDKYDFAVLFVQNELLPRLGFPPVP